MILHGTLMEGFAWEIKDSALDRQRLEMGRRQEEGPEKGRLETWKNERQRAAQERSGA